MLKTTKICFKMFKRHKGEYSILVYFDRVNEFPRFARAVFLPCPAKSMHLEPALGGQVRPSGFSVHAFGWTGQENIIHTCREAGNKYIITL